MIPYFKRMLDIALVKKLLDNTGNMYKGEE